MMLTKEQIKGLEKAYQEVTKEKFALKARVEELEGELMKRGWIPGPDSEYANGLDRPPMKVKDCCGQEIIPIPGRRLSKHTNRHPATSGDSWGWIEGCTLNICWSNENDIFTSKDASDFVEEYNKQTLKETDNDG